MKQAMIKSMVAALLSVAGVAQAGPYSSMVIFGDSLSDSGNNAALLGFTVPGAVIAGDGSYSQIPYDPPAGSPVGTLGTYSNGPVWASYVAASLGVSAAPSGVPGMPGFGSGTNYAFGGAQTSVDGTDGPGGFPFSLTKQVGFYLSATGGVASPDALYVVAGGGNNVRVALEAIQAGSNAAATFTATAGSYGSDIGGIVGTLQSLGAKHILVWNTPDFGLTPSALSADALNPGSSGYATALSAAMNQSLAAKVSCGQSGVICFDFFSFLNQTVANAAGLGLTNVINACGAAINACDVSTSLFWDAIHPTALGHELLADAVLGAITAAAVPEPATYGLMALGLVAVGWCARRDRQRSRQA